MLPQQHPNCRTSHQRDLWYTAHRAIVLAFYNFTRICISLTGYHSAEFCRLGVFIVHSHCCIRSAEPSIGRLRDSTVLRLPRCLALPTQLSRPLYFPLSLLYIHRPKAYTQHLSDTRQPTSSYKRLARQVGETWARQTLWRTTRRSFGSARLNLFLPWLSGTLERPSDAIM